MGRKATIIVASGDLDRLYSALIVGNGALSMGMEASMYFTFFGLNRLKKGGLEKGKLSRMNMGGLGTWMIKKLMRKRNVQNLEAMMKDFKELGGKIIACDMTMEIMGIGQEDLRSDLVDEYAAVGTYINEAQDSNITLYI